MKKKIILVVCRGNIARSPVAEVIINKELNKKHLNKEYIALSRGVQGTSVDPNPVRFPNITYYQDLYADVKPVLDRLEIVITSHVSTPVDRNIVEEANVILAVDIKTKQALSTLFPEYRNKMYLLSELINIEKDLTDPEGLSGSEKHLKVFLEIQEYIIKGFSRLIKLTESGIN